MRGFLFCALVAFGACRSTEENLVISQASIDQRAWHAQRLVRLQSEDGWLTLVGLEFLADGRFRAGSAADMELRYANCERAHIGTFVVESERVSFEPADGGSALELVADDVGAPSVVRSGSVSFTLLRRNDQLALRVKDNASAVRTQFRGIELFEHDPALVVQARAFEPEAPRMVAITNVTGFVEQQSVRAELEFSLHGRAYRFVATAGSAGGLFVVFGDASNGRDSYAGGRFLDLPAPKDGFVTIDFNRAYQPPCSFTPYATCPLPPDSNRIASAVLAGERVSKSAH